jgi:hypothetical protein
MFDSNQFDELGETVKTPSKFWAGVSFYKHLLPGIFAAMIAAAAFSGMALGDTLEMKTGQIVQGKFIGGSTMNIRFQVDGQEQIFSTKDVLNIGFSDASDASNVAPPPAQPAAQAPPFAPDATSAPTGSGGTVRQMSPQNSQQQAQQASQSTQAVTIPAGTSVFVRMIDGVDSSNNRIGDSFHASLESPLVVGDIVVAPKGGDVYGKLAQVKEAGKISGGAQLTLELTGIRINESIVPVDSTDYDVAGKGRGTQSAERIGGGAIAGAVIGGIIGGGKGAAVGATLGAGGGAAVQVMTHGDQVRIPSETLLEFKLQQDVMAPLSYTTN